MRWLFSVSFIVLVLLCLLNLWFILQPAAWLHVIAALFLIGLLFASVITMLSVPWGRMVGFVAFLVCLGMSVLLVLKYQPLWA